MHRRLRRLHRWIGLAFFAFWIVQALTGLFLVFHREMDDWAAGVAFRETDVERLGDRLQALQLENPNRHTRSIQLTNDAANRFDIFVEDNATGRSEIVRVDGAGGILSRRSPDEVSRSVSEIANRLHRTLLAGPTGRLIVGLSGIVLLSNLLVAIKLAWPGPRKWRRVLLPALAGASVAKLYAIHRALGLWVVALAILTVACGVMLAFHIGTEQSFAAHRPSPRHSAPVGGRIVTPAAAIGIARRRYPSSDFSGMILPNARTAFYEVQLRQKGEPPRMRGETRVYVEAGSGRVIGGFDPLRVPPAERAAQLVFPIHTGRIGGMAGRLGVMVIGLWLLTMIGLGLSLWTSRRRLKARKDSGKGKQETQSWNV